MPSCKEFISLRFVVTGLDISCCNYRLKMLFDFRYHTVQNLLCVDSALQEFVTYVLGLFVSPASNAFLIQGLQIDLERIKFFTVNAFICRNCHISKKACFAW